MNSVSSTVCSTYLCSACARKRGISHTIHYGTLIGGVPARAIYTPRARLKYCSDCGQKFRDIYRLTSTKYQK